MILIHLKRVDVVPLGVKGDLTQSISAGMHMTFGEGDYENELRFRRE
jgi:hypothetical protein